MKKIAFFMSCLSSPVNSLYPRVLTINDPEKLSEIINEVPLAVVYFGPQTNVKKEINVANKAEALSNAFERIASSHGRTGKKCVFVRTHLSSVFASGKHRLRKHMPLIQIYQNGYAAKDFRLVGYKNEEVVKKFIENKVGKQVENVNDDQATPLKEDACPQWIHDWYFYWPYQYYGYAHPYYWHDGFHISFGC